MPEATEPQQAGGSVDLAWTLTWAVLALDAVVVVGVWAQWVRAGERDPQRRDFASPLGWVAAVSAALVFGFSDLPVKLPSSQEAGPTVFNAYSFIGNGVVHCLLACSLHEAGGTFRFHWTGAFGALNMMVVQALARSAVWILGIAVGPPLWCAVGMATSYAWGTLAFGDRPSSMGMSIVGLAMLMAGVGLVSRAGYLSRVHEQERRRECSASSHEAGDVQAGAKSGKGLWDLATGALYATGAGIADGSLVAFYQHLERRGILQDKARDTLVAVFCSYFGTFGIVTFISGLAVLASVQSAKLFSSSDARDAACGGGSTASLHVLSFVPGAISGGMWAGASSCSVLGSHFLGMSIAFPITQTAVVFSALVGILLFNEILGWRARSHFGVAVAIIVAGAIDLASYGRPSPLQR